MPDAFELPWMLGAVVPQMGAHGAFVNEFVALALRHAIGRSCQPAARGFPCFVAVIGPLDDLSEPAATLRRVQPVRVNRRAFDVINLPAAKVRSADIPSCALAIRSQDERALFCANQNSYFAHRFLP